MIKKILGFLHYRTDLGDGVRTGVVFADCTEACRGICSDFVFIPEHEFCEDSLEKNEYTAKELADYLKEETTMYYARKLGISFLGREPLRDPFFCTDVAKELKDLGIGLQIHTCGMCSMVAFEYLDGLVDQYLLRVFLSSFSNECSDFQSRDHLLRVISFLEEHQTPYRIQLFFSDHDSIAEIEAFADYVLQLHYLKSILLDFSDMRIPEDIRISYRTIFLKRKIPLY